MPNDTTTTSPLALPAPTTVPDVITRLADIQTWIEATSRRGDRDGVACFNFLYHVITCRVLEWIDDGRFADAEFLTTLDLVFAGRYLDALRAHDADPATAPRSWAALFENRDESDIDPMQFAAAGVNAHVNFDLPCAVLTTCEQLGREPGFGTQRADYDKVNEIFAVKMEDLRQHFQSDFERLLDELLFRHVQNILGNFSVEAARDTAWTQAGVLWALRDNAGAQQGLIQSIDKFAGLAGRGLMVHL
ncbi:MAG: DUF5995 family protein [Acidimicrobiales bacterium]